MQGGRLPSLSLSLLAAIASLALTAPPVAASEWSTRMLPQPPESGNSHEAYDVACLTEDDCVAVGGNWSLQLHARATLAEAWDGEAWTPVPTPNPPGLEEGWQFGRYAILSSVACLSPSDCVAVGEYQGTADVLLPLIEHWDGSEWAIAASPLPAGATAGTLLGVSCSSASDCVAVGEFTDASSVRRTLAMHWDGEEWSAEATPHPAGSLRSRLFDVSCASPGACTAVGLREPSAEVARTLALRWDGAKWATQTTQDPPGNEATNRLWGVSCPTASACVAVGLHLERVSTRYVGTPLAEHWNGTAWSVEAVPTAGDEGSNLASVSCTAMASCTAVGSYHTSTGSGSYAEVFGARWEGGAWDLLDLPGLPDPPGWWHDRWLRGVSCVAPERCVAVGDSLSAPEGGLSPYRAFAEHEGTPPAKTEPVAGPADGIGTPPSLGPPTGPPPAGPPPLPPFEIRGARALRDGSLAFLLWAPGPGRFVARASSAKATPRLRYGRATALVSDPGLLQLRISPSREAREALAAGRRPRLRVTISFASSEGQSMYRRIDLRARGTRPKHPRQDSNLGPTA